VINTTFVASGLESNAAYQFRVSAVSALGEGLPGQASDTVSTLPGPMPPPFQQAFLNTILLSWSPPANATTTGYRIYFQEFSSTVNAWLPSTVQVYIDVHLHFAVFVPSHFFLIKVKRKTPYLIFCPQVVAASVLTAKFDSLKADNLYRFWLAARNPSGWGADGARVRTPHPSLSWHPVYHCHTLLSPCTLAWSRSISFACIKNRFSAT
jgi:hypothetical protein